MKTFKDIKRGSFIYRLNDDTGEITKVKISNVRPFENGECLAFFENGKLILASKNTESEHMYVGILGIPTVIFYANEIEALKRSNYLLSNKIRKLENGLKQWLKK